MKVKGCLKIHHTNINKKLGIAILIPEKIDFTENKITRDKKILHNDEMINPQELIILNFYILRNRVSIDRK